MKKALILISIFAAASPVVYAETSATVSTQSTPAQKAATSTASEDNKYPWLKNVSGNLTFVTNYVFRGISQNRNLPAAQGGLTYTFPINFYVNLWGSNVSFVDSHGANATVELDTIVGYRNTYGDNFSYDINIDRYNYPGARHANYNELNTVFAYYFLQAGISYSANVYNTHQSGTYYNGGINYDIPSKWALGVCDLNLLATLGRNTLEE